MATPNPTRSRVFTIAAVALLALSACSPTTVARLETFNVVTANVLINPDPAAIDDATAELKSILGPGQAIVSADFAACEVTQVDARASVGQLWVTYTVDPDFDCELPDQHRALFLIPTEAGQVEVTVARAE